MSILPVVVLLVIHLILCAILLIYSLVSKSSLRKENIIPTLFLPIFGPFAALLIEWISRSGRAGKKLEEILLLPLEDDILWKTIKNHNEGGNIIPLEEALLINENSTKRKMMLDALYDDPLKYLDVLLIASHNQDVETAHYATTTISHSQRRFQIEVQKTKTAVEEHPKDPKILDYYILLVEKYINSGLLEEHLLRNQRLAYSEALDKKLAFQINDKATFVKKLRNCIQLAEFDAAFRISDELKAHWPEDEEVWNEALRVCIEAHDKERLQETIDEILITPIRWTKQGKEKIDHWIAGAI